MAHVRYLRLLQKKGIENQQLFDGKIEVTLFDRIKGLDYQNILFLCFSDSRNESNM